MISDIATYGALFASAVLAATIVPAQSEIGLAYLVSQQNHHLFALLCVASLGNITGALVNWYLGVMCARYQGRAWFPIKAEKLARATSWFQTYGKWSLLLSWVPIIGDPITVAAGVLRTPFWTAFILISLAKTARYCVIIGLTIVYL